MRKIMFFDIDGTLIDESPQHITPESTLRGLDMARKAGNLLFVNTGRPRAVVGENVRRLGFDGYVYGCGTNIEIDGEEIFYRTNTPEVCENIVRLVRECDASPMYERRDGNFYDPAARDLAFNMGVKEGFIVLDGKLSRTVSEPGFGFDKFVICFDEKTDIQRFRRGIEGLFDYIDRGKGFAELVPCGFGKGRGIERVLDTLGIDKSAAYAIGDSLNDLPMKPAVGTFISMGNGVKLIPHADHVTDDIHKDGVYKALERFGFFERK